MVGCYPPSQRFGSALNAHTRLHCCVTDWVFSLAADGTLHFHPAVDLDATVVSAAQQRIRTRVLRMAVHHGALTPEVAADLARWGHGVAFSLHAAVRIESEDCAGDRASARSRTRRRRPPPRLDPRGPAARTDLRAPAAHLPRCQGPMRLIAFLTEPPSIRAILAHVGEPTNPPVLASSARAPPEPETEGIGTAAIAFDQSPSWDPAAAPPDPGFSFDQTVA